MSKKTKILKAPLVLLVIGSFLISVYAVATGGYDMSIATPIILGIILGMYYFGCKKEKQENK